METNSIKEKYVRKRMNKSGKYCLEISFLSVSQIEKLINYHYQVIDKSNCTIDAPINSKHKQIIEEFESYLQEFTIIFSKRIPCFDH